MKSFFCLKLFRVLGILSYVVGKSTVLAISRYSAYQPEGDGEIFNCIYESEN